jgi:hypothetical protein
MFCAVNGQKMSDFSNTEFLEQLKEQYGVTDRNGNMLPCVLCCESVVYRTTSVDGITNLSIKVFHRKVRKGTANSTTTCLINLTASSSNVLAASFQITESTARHGKQTSDSEFLK